MFGYTDDPARDFLSYDAEQQSHLDELPKCANCYEPIQQDSAVCIDGKWYCDECLRDFRTAI